jgi:hypothetical protein
MNRIAVLVVSLLLFSASHAFADFYRWVDDEGKEFFTNDPKQIPQEYRGKAVVITPDERRVSVADKPASSRPAPAVVKEHKDKNGKGEEYWRRKAENLRLKLREQQDEYDLVLQQLDEQDRKAPYGNGKKKKKSSSLEKKKLKLEKEMARTKRMLETDLPEEARRADAYPGWIRE